MCFWCSLSLKTFYPPKFFIKFLTIFLDFFICFHSFTPKKPTASTLSCCSIFTLVFMSTKIWLFHQLQPEVQIYFKPKHYCQQQLLIFKSSINRLQRSKNYHRCSYKTSKQNTNITRTWQGKTRPAGLILQGRVSIRIAKKPKYNSLPTTARKET